MVSSFYFFHKGKWHKVADSDDSDVLKCYVDFCLRYNITFRVEYIKED